MSSTTVNNAEPEDDFWMRFGTYLAKGIPKWFNDNPVKQSMRMATLELDTLLDTVQHSMDEFPCTMLFTGSSVDGVFNKSDVDIMYCMKHFIVVENEDQIPDGHTKGVLLMDIENCSPCYTRLKLLTPHPDEEVMGGLFTTEQDGTQYLLRERFLELGEKYFTQRLETEIAGPSHKAEGHDGSGRPEVDRVPCLECPFWPMQANTDFTDSVKARDSFTSCHVVGVPHKKSSRPDVEFRISFSLAEKRFAHSWSDFEMKCFHYFKHVMKEYAFLGQTPLSSYHIKTLFFWMIDTECIVQNLDTNEYLYQNMLLFFNYFFKKCIRERRMSHFFMPAFSICDHLEERDFQMYLVALEHNFKELPRELPPHVWTNKRDDMKELEDEFNCKVTEILHLRSNAWSLESICYYWHAEYEFFTLTKFQRIINESASCRPRTKALQGALVRCQATLQLYEALSSEDRKGIERERSLNEVLDSYLSLVNNDSESCVGVAQCDLANLTHIALYYYLVGDHAKCREYISQAWQAKEKCGDIHFYICKSDILLPAGKKPECVPVFFKDEVFRHFFKMNSFKHQPAVVNAVVILAYLHHRVTGTTTFLMGKVDPSFKSFSSRSRYNSITLIEFMKYGEVTVERDNMVEQLIEYTAAMKIAKLDEETTGTKFDEELMVIMRSGDESMFPRKLEIVKRLFGTDPPMMERMFEVISNQCYE